MEKEPKNKETEQNPDSKVVSEVKKYKNGLGVESSRNIELGAIEAEKRLEYINVIQQEARKLLLDLYNTTEFSLRPCGSVASRLCTSDSDIDLELFVSKEHPKINTINFNKELNNRLSIPYRAEVHPWYLDNPSHYI